MPKALVVDDDRLTLKVAEAILKNEGHDVVLTNDGSKVKQLIETEAPDVLVIDIFMPNTDGIENIIAIHAEHPELPIIAISSDNQYLKMAEKLGATRSVLKPLHNSNLSFFVAELTQPH